MLCFDATRDSGGHRSAALSSSTAWAQGRTAKPNIVYIMADDLLRRPFLLRSARVSHSNIDSIAANGMKFLQAYANLPSARRREQR
jgi:hypothetical protein